MDIFTALVLFGGVYITGLVFLAVAAAIWDSSGLLGGTPPAVVAGVAGVAGVVSVRYPARSKRR